LCPPEESKKFGKPSWRVLGAIKLRRICESSFYLFIEIKAGRIRNSDMILSKKDPVRIMTGYGMECHGFPSKYYEGRPPSGRIIEISVCPNLSFLAYIATAL
jgi:hypothetical protein